MKIYKTGEPCPCCGQPIRLTDRSALRLFSIVVDMLGLEGAAEAAASEPWKCGECKEDGTQLSSGYVVCPVNGELRTREARCSWDL